MRRKKTAGGNGIFLEEETGTMEKDVSSWRRTRQAVLFRSLARDLVALFLG